MIRVPVLNCPIDSAINIHAEETMKHTDSWVRKFELHQGDTFAKYQGDNFAFMSARFYPFCNLEKLCLVNDLNVALFVMDDAMDNQIDKTELVQSKDNYIDFYDKVIGILDNKIQPALGITGIFPALSDLWKRLEAISTDNWRRSFIADIKKMFDAGMWEFENVQEGKLPTEQEFYKKRPFLGAAHISTALIPVIEQISLPESILEHINVRELTELTQRIVCWANDLFSYTKEREHGDKHNMIEVIRRNSNLSLKNAILRTAQIHNNDMEKFIQISQELPSFGNYDKELKKYVRILGAILRGNIDWSINETKRYTFEYGG